MCGIAGFIDFNKSSTELDIKSMITPLNHRGPDGEGTLILNNKNAIIGFGHKRLSIIDLSIACLEAQKLPRFLEKIFD